MTLQKRLLKACAITMNRLSFFCSSPAKRSQHQSEKISKFFTELKLLANKACPQDTQVVRDQIVLQSFIDVFHNVHVRFELRKNKMNDVKKVLESALQFDAICRVESNAIESPTSATSVSSIDLLSSKIDKFMAGQLSYLSCSCPTNNKMGSQRQLPSLIISV